MPRDGDDDPVANADVSGVAIAGRDDVGRCE
jgi:hypothetical protein